MILTGTEEVYDWAVDHTELASRAVDDYCGRSFEPPTTKTVTVNDVRTPIVPLPTPFRDVTAVTVNGAVVSASGYVVEPWGLRLYRPALDADGFPVRTAVSGPWGGGRHPYGAQVKVTATFGWDDIPAAVSRATRLLAEHFAGQRHTVTASTDDEGNPTTLPTSAAKPTATLVGPDQKPVADTTGLIDADRLLRPFRRPQLA